MSPLKLRRFEIASAIGVRIGLIENEMVLDLTSVGVQRMKDVLERTDLADELQRLSRAGSARYNAADVRFLTPVESQEVWAAGVTYL